MKYPLLKFLIRCVLDLFLTEVKVFLIFCTHIYTYVTCYGFLFNSNTHFFLTRYPSVFQSSVLFLWHHVHFRLLCYFCCNIYIFLNLLCSLFLPVQVSDSISLVYWFADFRWCCSLVYSTTLKTQNYKWPRKIVCAVLHFVSLSVSPGWRW